MNFSNIRNLKVYEGSFTSLKMKYKLNNFDLIICNILANVINNIIPDIYSSTNNQGKVILSGILSSQKEEILQKLISNKFKILDVKFKKDWICIMASK